MDILKELEIKSAELTSRFREEMGGIRGGRPTAKLVENIMIDYSGQKLMVKQIGSISVSPPRELQITVWDREVISGLVKAVESTLNVKASVDNNLVRISLPSLSEERRAELVKTVKKEAEEIKIRIRTLRDEALKKVKQQEEKGEITEDDRFRLKEQIQKNIDKINGEVEKIVENKTREISE